MNTVQDYITLETRRQFFRKSAAGLGGAALASLLGQDSVLGAAGAASTGGTFHHTPKAKRAIYLFMSGAPSQIDLWDHKPKMDALYDKDLPPEIRNGQRLTTMTSGQARFPVAPSIYQFQKHGQAGTEVSELLPYTAKMVDDIAVVRSMWTEAINHPSISPLPQEFTQPFCRTNEQKIIQFVKIPFVEQELVKPRMLTCQFLWCAWAANIKYISRDKAG